MFTAQKIIETEIYQNLLAQLQQHTGMTICPEYETTLAKFDTECLAHAHLSEDDVMRLLASNAESLLNFAACYYETFRDAPDEQEYPEGYDPDPDDDDGNIVNLGQGKNTLLQNLIVYALLKYRPDDVLPYYKAMGMPYAKKFAREVKAVLAASEAA